MPIDEMDGKRSKRRPSLTGVVMMDVSSGKERVRVWPKSRGRTLSDKTKNQMEWFRQAQWATKYWPAICQWQYAQAVSGTPLLPRDLMTMNMAGRMNTIAFNNGKVIWPVVARQDVSASLDILGNQQGYMLIRGASFWEAQPVPLGPHPWYWQPPLVSQMTVVSPTGNVPTMADDSDVGLLCYSGPYSGFDEFRALTQPISSPFQPFEFVCRIDGAIGESNFQGLGVLARDAVSGAATVLLQQNNAEWTVEHTTDFLSTTGGTPNGSIRGPAPYYFWKIKSDGTNLSVHKSTDGKIFRQFHVESLASFLANGIGDVGVCFRLLTFNDMPIQFSVAHFSIGY